MNRCYIVSGIIAIIIIAAYLYFKVEDVAENEWNTYKLQYNKNYGSEEEYYRRSVFMKNWMNVINHNMKYDMGLLSYKLALNKFADKDTQEMKSVLNGYRQKNIDEFTYYSSQFIDIFSTFEEDFDLPASVDWREKGAVTPVKDQGECGSCWAFSATGSLEGQHFIKNGTLVSLSEQNLIDCSSNFGNAGCDGGLMEYAFLYINRNKGLDTEMKYPYEGIDDNCRYNPKYSGATDFGYVRIPRGREDKLALAVATVGPISVAIDASLESFQFYEHGIYSDPECSSDILDHGVLVVGYGTEKGKDYWLVKNSWSESWGDQGYIKIARNKHNMCGIATSATYPKV